MAMRAHYAAAKEDCDRNSQLFQELPEFKVVAVTVVERDDERFRRQPPHLTLRPGAQIVSKRDDMVAGSERLKMIPGPHPCGGMIDENSNLPPLRQLAQQERYPGIAKKDEDTVPKKSRHHSVGVLPRSLGVLPTPRCSSIPSLNYAAIDPQNRLHRFRLAVTFHGRATVEHEIRRRIKHTLKGSS